MRSKLRDDPRLTSPTARGHVHMGKVLIAAACHLERRVSRASDFKLRPCPEGASFPRAGPIFRQRRLHAYVRRTGPFRPPGINESGQPWMANFLKVDPTPMPPLRYVNFMLPTPMKRNLLEPQSRSGAHGLRCEASQLPHRGFQRRLHPGRRSVVHPCSFHS